MPIKTIKHIISEAMTVARQADAERIAEKTTEKKLTLPDRATAIKNIARTRQNATSTAQEAPSTTMDQIHELEAAIGSLQLGVDAATADVANAHSPDARKKAEQRLAGLLKQMARLQHQLWLGRQRQINEGGASRKLKF